MKLPRPIRFRSAGLRSITATTGLSLCLLALPLHGSALAAEDTQPSCCDWPTAVSTYLVEGGSLPELRRALDAIAASGSHGGSHYGYTRWRFRVPSTRAPDCTPATLRLVADIEVVLPEAKNLTTLSPADQAKWLRYVDALKAHELEHVEIVDHGLDSMQSAIVALATCDQAVAVARAHERAIQKASDDLDRTTDHGRNGDVVFPD